MSPKHCFLSLTHYYRTYCEQATIIPTIDLIVHLLPSDQCASLLFLLSSWKPVSYLKCSALEICLLVSRVTSYIVHVTHFGCCSMFPCTVLFLSHVCCWNMGKNQYKVVFGALGWNWWQRDGRALNVALIFHSWIEFVTRALSGKTKTSEEHGVKRKQKIVAL